MPLTEVSLKPRVTTSQLTDALDLAPGGADGLRFTDRFGVTYDGNPAHVTLAALLRPDITPNLCGKDKQARSAARWGAGLIVAWFTNQHTRPEHATALAGLPPHRMCRAVAELATHGAREHLEQVGPQALHLYTEWVLLVAGLDEEAAPPELPRVIDRTRTWLGETGNLDLTATTPQGADTVTLHVDVRAFENISWHFTTGVEFPIAELHALLTGEIDLGGYIADDRELIEHHLNYADSQLDEGLDVEATLLDGPPPAPEPEAPSATVTLFYVGRDQAHALSGEAFLRREDAEQALTEPDYQVFTGIVQVSTLVAA